MTTQEPCNNCGKTHPYFECDKAKPMMNEERIKADAVKLYPFPEQDGFRAAYIAGVTAENDRAQVLVEALEEFISYHETGLLPARHVYEKAVANLEQWKGKEVEPKEPPLLLNTCGICKERPIGNGLTVCDECYQSFDGDRRGFWDSETYQ